MNNSTNVTPRKSHWRPWQVLLALLIVLVLSFFGYQWYQEKQNEARLQAAILATDLLDPEYRQHLSAKGINSDPHV